MASQYMRLHPIKFGFALGLWWGIGLLIVSWISLRTGYGIGLIQGLSSVYLGYTATFVGGIIGFVWGFIDFFIFGLLVAWIYNSTLGSRS
jgi:hypothetical protein